MPVEYPWKPTKCDLCKVFGHSFKNCTKKLKLRWTSKKNGLDLDKTKSTVMKNVVSDIHGENIKDSDGRNTTDNDAQNDWNGYDRSLSFSR